MLVRHFAEVAAKEQGLPPRRFSDEALERLVTLDWPGNVRELRNTVERLLILAHRTEVSAADVDRLTAGAADGAGVSGDLLTSSSYAEFKRRAERAYILAKLREHEWNVSETARAIDMPRSNLYKKIDKHRLVREEA